MVIVVAAVGKSLLRISSSSFFVVSLYGYVDLAPGRPRGVQDSSFSSSGGQCIGEDGSRREIAAFKSVHPSSSGLIL